MPTRVHEFAALQLSLRIVDKQSLSPTALAAAPAAAHRCQSRWWHHLQPERQEALQPPVQLLRQAELLQLVHQALAACSTAAAASSEGQGACKGANAGTEALSCSIRATAVLCTVAEATPPASQAATVTLGHAFQTLFYLYCSQQVLVLVHTGSLVLKTLISDTKHRRHYAPSDVKVDKSCPLQWHCGEIVKKICTSKRAFSMHFNTMGRGM
jgi:hypothetical protein